MLIPAVVFLQPPLTDFASQTVLSPRGRAHTTFRTLVFIGLGLSGVLPLGHLAWMKGLGQLRREGGVDEMALGGLWCVRWEVPIDRALDLTGGS
jgi:predicted membrane channel-forming protein YqfA (hemolysin III family)